MSDHDQSWAVRVAGSPLFSFSGEQIYDLADFCSRHNLSAEARSSLLEDLLLHGQSELGGSPVELLDGQELARQIEA